MSRQRRRAPGPKDILHRGPAHPSHEAAWDEFAKAIARQAARKAAARLQNDYRNQNTNGDLTDDEREH